MTVLTVCPGCSGKIGRHAVMFINTVNNDVNKCRKPKNKFQQIRLAFYNPIPIYTFTFKVQNKLPQSNETLFNRFRHGFSHCDACQ